MTKLKILITLLLTFLFVSNVYAEGLIGKGVICEGIDGPWHPQVWFFDDDEKIHHIDFDDSRIEGIFIYEKKSYTANAKRIIWVSIDANSTFALSRKTLKLKIEHLPSSNSQSKEASFHYQCRVTNWAGIEEFFKPQMDKHQEDLKKNKI